MTDPKPYIKWFSRCLFLVLIALMSYVLFQPHYNFAHWVPHDLLRNSGVPYSAVLYFESNADKLLHPLGALILTLLLITAKLPFFSHSESHSKSNSKIHVCLILVCGIVITEILQWRIGRGFEISDMLLGFIGVFIGYRLSQLLDSL